MGLSSLQILTELEHSGIGRIKEQSARMLGHLVSNAPRLIRPYMEPILKVTHNSHRDWHLPSGSSYVSSFGTMGMWHYIHSIGPRLGDKSHIKPSW